MGKFELGPASWSQPDPTSDGHRPLCARTGRCGDVHFTNEGANLYAESIREASLRQRFLRCVLIHTAHSTLPPQAEVAFLASGAISDRPLSDGVGLQSKPRAAQLSVGAARAVAGDYRQVMRTTRPMTPTARYGLLMRAVAFSRS
jgi:hypothetical protein